MCAPGKLLFFDIDGTIITQDSYVIPLSTIRAIRKARDNGHIAIINTGRPFGHIETKIRDIGFDGFICTCGMHVQFHDMILKDVHLPIELCLFIRDFSRECKVEMAFESTDAMIFEDPNIAISHNILDKKRSHAEAGIPIIIGTDYYGFQFDKFLAWKSSATDWDRFFEVIKCYFYVINHYDLFECIPIGYSKATGVKDLIKYLGIPIIDTFAFGDSQNDLLMLKSVGTSVLMGNAPDTLKSEADYIAPNITDDGLDYALNYLNLLG